VRVLASWRPPCRSFDRITVALRAARRARVSPWPGPRSLLGYRRVPATPMGPSCSAVVGSGQQAWRGHDPPCPAGESASPGPSAECILSYSAELTGSVPRVDLDTIHIRKRPPDAGSRCSESPNTALGPRDARAAPFPRSRSESGSPSGSDAAALRSLAARRLRGPSPGNGQPCAVGIALLCCGYAQLWRQRWP